MINFPGKTAKDPVCLRLFSAYSNIVYSITILLDKLCMHRMAADVLNDTLVLYASHYVRAGTDNS